ncbi:MAG: PAS domain S-box protein [Planctomycetes bacterium]|nr:PAS domain S-box protein [Planctomycetota bacterium]
MSPSRPPLNLPMLAVAMLAGLAGLALDRPIDILAEPVRVGLIFGSVLPMVVAMAWGWRAGLAAATLGLAAAYPFVLWEDNGWANLPTSLMNCAWFSLHGWAAARREGGRGRWWHNAYAVELAFDLLFVVYLLTVFRWCFALNPAPWAQASISDMPLPVAWIIACKTAINGLVVVMLADAALHLAPLRRLLRLPLGDERRYDGLIILLGAAAGLALWVADAVVVSLLAPGGVRWDEVLVPDPRLLLPRLLLAALGLAGALMVAAFVRRRLRLADELQESLAQHRQIIRTAMDGFCLLDGEGRLLEVNEAYARMSGYSPGELLALTLADLEAAETPAKIQEHLRRIRAQGADRFETRHRRKDGSVFDIEVSVQYRPEQGGRISAFLRDICERKQAVEALELERTLYKDLVAAMPAGVYRCKVIYAKPLREDAWEQRVEISLVSDAFCRILGVTREACEADAGIVVGRIHPDDRAEFARLNILGQTSLTPFNWEGRIVRDGEVRWVHFASHPRRLDDGNVIWTGVLFDTTGLRRAEAEQHRLAEQLRQREKMDAIGQLAGGIAHDFNNQLAGVLGYADLLEARVQDPALKRHAAAICAAARRAADLTQQLLAFARKGKYRSIPTDLHAVAQEVAELLRRSIDKRIVVTLRLEASPATVLGDPTQIQGVLLNLGLNARDAMPQGGELVISTWVQERAGEAGDAGRRLGVSVRDSGIGMDAETRRRLFEPFFTTKGVGQGTGLGLASAYGVVKNHGGTIQVWSEPGRGSVFTILLPLLEDGQAAPAAEVLPAGRRPLCGCILVVDDEPPALAVVGDLLQAMGYEVLACGDPAEALALYRGRWRDVGLVILDMVMPRMGGRDLFLAMRAVNPGIRAVLSSGFSLDGEAQAILDAGVRAFVQKPFDRATLAHTLEVAIRE